ncbi:Panacea domain-containing protein [Streptomyces lydicus]|uniref:Panacea domain-containing protein n=1 Tax=Streptomyces lydicus TaxID=47763 RepID=UPI0036FD2EC3
MKLQRLVYYCQAWHLAWAGNALFPERLLAWASVPVCPELYELHQGHFTVQADSSSPNGCVCAATSKPPDHAQNARGPAPCTTPPYANANACVTGRSRSR